MPRSASNHTVTERLRADVVSGHFPPNKRLVEHQLTERYDTGRASVRAAILELTKEGLLTREANRGATVRALTLEEAREIYEARSAIEALIARHAAKQITEAEREHLRSGLEEMRESAKNGDTARFAKIGQGLNGDIHEIGRHRVAQDLIRVLANQSHQIPAPLSTYWDQKEKFMGEASEIIEAIIEGDAERADRAVRVHYATIISALTLLT